MSSPALFLLKTKERVVMLVISNYNTKRRFAHKACAYSAPASFIFITSKNSAGRFILQLRFTQAK